MGPAEGAGARGSLAVPVQAAFLCLPLPSSSAVHETPNLLFSPSALKAASLMVRGCFPAEPAYAAGAPCKPQQGRGFTGQPRYFPDSLNPLSRSQRGCPGGSSAWIPKGLGFCLPDTHKLGSQSHALLHSGSQRCTGTVPVCPVPCSRQSSAAHLGRELIPSHPVPSRCRGPTAKVCASPPAVPLALSLPPGGQPGDLPLGMPVCGERSGNAAGCDWV